VAAAVAEDSAVDVGAAAVGPGPVTADANAADLGPGDVMTAAAEGDATGSRGAEADHESSIIINNLKQG